jgi:hypothetical protein
METIEPNTLAGTLTVPQLNGYVAQEVARLEALGFSKYDLTIGIPLDHTEVYAAVLVPTGGPRRACFPSSEVVGRAADGRPLLS